METALAEAPAPAAQAGIEPSGGDAAPASERVRIEAGSAPVRGAAGAPVTVVVYSDFQCPFCARGADRMKEIAQRYGERVRFVFKHQPLPMHGDAKLAAVASIAAAEQGRFWEFHDALFARQGELDRAGLRQRAAELGLDGERFAQALDDAGLAAKVAADQEEAERLGVRGTPTFFVNGRKLIGAQPLASFTAVIDEELGAKDR
jgi:protein-disulfide isomerase